MTTNNILYQVETGIARITLNRPERLNAVDFETGKLWQQLTEKAASDPEVKAIILDANGPAFCAGGDVIAMSQSGGGGSEVTETAKIINAGIQNLVETPKPVVAAVHGAVAGGGLGLLLSADYIVANSKAKFVSKYANIGLTPDLGVSTLLRKAVGERRALQLLLQDKTISAAEALDWGLVSELIPDSETADSAQLLKARVQEVAEFWINNAYWAFGQAKRLVRAGAERSFSENLLDEAETIGKAFDTEEARARITIFAKGNR